MKKLILAVALVLGSFAMTAPQKAEAQQFWLGQIVLGGWNFCPRTTAAAAGQLLAISSNTALFSLYGTNYGGDGRTSFGLPDLRGTVAVSEGQRPGLSFYRLGQFSGRETHTMNVLELPSHNHLATSTATATLFAEEGGSTATNAAGNLLADGAANTYATDGRGATTTMSSESLGVTVTTTLGNTGNNQAFNIRGPYLALQYCVVTAGTFPSRS